jgi:hypothetical protein
MLLLGGNESVRGQELQPAEPQVGAEVIERRTAHSRHIYLGEGHYQAEIFAQPIHVLNAQGEWQLIDPSGEGLETSNGTIEELFGYTDTYIITGNLEYRGSDDYMQVGRLNSTMIERSLIYKNAFYGLPAYSLIDGDSGSDVIVKLYLEDAWDGSGWGSGNDRYIAAYEITNLWQEASANWFNRFTDTPWTIPGGDYNGGILDIIALAEVGDTWGYQNWSGFTLRDLIALWRTNIVDTPGFPFGRVPYGLLFALYDESDTTIRDLKKFSTSEHTGSSQDPKLVVNYQDGPLALGDSTPIERRVPSPDYYSIPSSGYWQVVATRILDNALANYNLELYSESGFHTREARSDYPAKKVNLVAIDPGLPDAAHYPLTYSENGEVGNYRIEYQQRQETWAGAADPGDTHGPYTMEPAELVHSYTFFGDSVPCTDIIVDGGNIKLGAAFFQYGYTPDRVYSRDQAVAQQVSTTGGGDLRLCPHFSTVGPHLLVVWNAGGTTDTHYNVWFNKFESNFPLIKRMPDS